MILECFKEMVLTCVNGSSSKHVSSKRGGLSKFVSHMAAQVLLTKLWESSGPSKLWRTWL